MGERTPHLDSNARGALVGLTASHTRAHVVRAILEGVAFSLRDTFTLFREMNVPVANIRLGGGGARSPLWRQIQADVYGHAVRSSKPKKAPRTARRSSPALGPACGLPSTSPAMPPFASPHALIPNHQPSPPSTPAIPPSAASIPHPRDSYSQIS